MKRLRNTSQSRFVGVGFHPGLPAGAAARVLATALTALTALTLPVFLPGGVTTVSPAAAQTAVEAGLLTALAGAGGEGARQLGAALDAAVSATAPDIAPAESDGQSGGWPDRSQTAEREADLAPGDPPGDEAAS
jgi:hypothetical protein